MMLTLKRKKYSPRKKYVELEYLLFVRGLSRCSVFSMSLYNYRQIHQNPKWSNRLNSSGSAVAVKRQPHRHVAADARPFVPLPPLPHPPSPQYRRQAGVDVQQIYYP